MKSDYIWPIFCGGSLIVTGLYWLNKRSIAVKIQRGPKLFRIKGIYAMIFGILLIVTGVVILLYPEILSFFTSKF